MASWLVKGGRVLDPANGIDEVLDVLVERGHVSRVGKNLKAAARAAVIDAKFKLVCPGLIDMHVHLREPGREDEETVESGSRAAAKGGFASVACMPNTDPPIDTSAVVEMIRDKADKEGLVNVFVVASFTKGLAGKELSEMGDLMAAGAVTFSNDGQGIQDAEVMRRALEYAKMFGVALIVHAEDKALSADGQMNEGYYATLLGLKGIPAAAEEVIVSRDLALARLAGARVHFTHVSTGGSVELIRLAKKEGINVTCDATPHHLILTDEELMQYDTNLKVSPPLRSADDRAALRKALAEGVIDAIASDHAPHAPQEKEREFEYAAPGMIGLETSLPLVWTELVKKKDITAKRMVEAMSVNPARILGITEAGHGTLSEGAVADITIIDPEATVEVDTGKLESRSRNTPFAGRKLEGRATHVLVGGELVHG